MTTQKHKLWQTWKSQDKNLTTQMATKLKKTKIKTKLKKILGGANLPVSPLPLHLHFVTRIDATSVGKLPENFYPDLFLHSSSQKLEKLGFE